MTVTKKTAVPANYAECGAAFGLETARQTIADTKALSTPLEIWLRSPHHHDDMKKVRSIIFETKSKFVADGASNDEAELYESAFERAFAAQVAAPDAPITVKIK